MPRAQTNGRDVQEGLLDVAVESSRRKAIDEDITDGPFFTSQRWILVYNGLFFGIMLYVFRVNVSIAIVSMATGDLTSTGSMENVMNVTVNNARLDLSRAGLENESVVYSEESESDTGSCKKRGVGQTQFDDRHAEFTWNSRTQSFVLSAYFYGYMISQVPGGWLSGRFGGKHVVSVSMAITSIASLLSPLLARSSVYALIAARVVTGICGGASMSAWFALVGVWALPTERSRFTAIYWFGQIAGTVVGYTTSGYLCSQGFDNGWGSVFYVDGIAGCVFVVLWMYCVHNSPEEHPRISFSEKRLLAQYLKTDVKQRRKTDKVPWVSIVTSPAVIAIVVTNFADAWLLYILLTCLPLFLAEVLNFEIQNNGLFSSLPFVTMCAGLAVSGVMADYINTRHWLKTTNIRKLFQITGNIGMALFVVVAGYITCDKRELVILCLCLCTFMEAIGSAPGYPCNPIDMAPRFAGIIYGISSTIASIPGIVAPVVVAEMTKNQTIEEWRRIFFICAGLSIFAALVYGVFSTSDLVTWSGDVEINMMVHVKNTTVGNDKSGTDDKESERLKDNESDVSVYCDKHTQNPHTSN